MKEVIRIDHIDNHNEKTTVFTHVLSSVGWVEPKMNPRDFEKVIYLGRCSSDGDMFAAYLENHIRIYKGHLNSGKY